MKAYLCLLVTAYDIYCMIINEKKNVWNFQGFIFSEMSEYVPLLYNFSSFLEKGLEQSNCTYSSGKI